MGSKLSPSKLLSPKLLALAGLFVFFAVLGGALVSCSSDSDERTKFVIATDIDYPPFSYKRNGEIGGFDYEYGNELCEAINAECEWVALVFDDLLVMTGDGTSEGVFDFAISSTSITPIREENVAFTTPYYYTGIQFVGEAEEGNVAINDFSALAGKTIALHLGTIFQDWLTSGTFEEDFDLVYYDTQQEAFEAVNAGEADFALADDLLVQEAVNSGELPNLVLKSERLPRSPFSAYLGTGAVGVIAPIGETDLIDLLNAGISQLKSNGTAGRLSQDYFGRDITIPLS